MGLAARNIAPSGKKALPALTPEYLPGLETFTRKYFEELFSRLGSSVRSLREKRKPAVLVFDNYQDVPSDSSFHEVIVNGLKVITDGINVIVISRSEPPAAYVRLRASSWISSVGWDDLLKLTLDESRSISRLPGKKELGRDLLSSIHERSTGGRPV
jgi:LuxR family maltose regulon positive regulatory protein